MRESVGDFAPRALPLRPLDSYDTTRLSRDLPQPPGDLRVNQRIRGVNEDLAVLRADLVVTHKPSRTVVIVDVAVPFENIFETLKKEKILKY